MRVGEKSSDAELVRQVLKGDKNTFSLLYSRHETSLHSFAFNKMHNHEDAKDIVQETFVAIWQNLRELKDPQKFPNWMFGIASRIIAKKYRERQKLIECLSLSRDANEAEVSNVAAVFAHRRDEQHQELVDMRDRLARAIEQLPDSERQPLLLRLSGMSHKEIAQELGLSEAVVNNRLARGRKRLKSLVHKLTE